MGRNDSSESEDDSRDRRDKFRDSSKRNAESNGYDRRNHHGDESEFSDSDRKNWSRRHERSDEKDVKTRDRRQRKEPRERKEHARISDEDDRRVEREKGRQDREKAPQREESQGGDNREGRRRLEEHRDRAVERERGRQDKEKTHQRERQESEDEDDREGYKRLEQRRDTSVERERGRQDREKTHDRERQESEGEDDRKGHKRLEQRRVRAIERERGRQDREKTHQRKRQESDDEDDREGHKRSEQHRDRTVDNNHRGYRNEHDRRYLKDRKGREGDERREDKVSRKDKEEGEFREDDPKSQKQSTLQENSLNADASNWGRSGGVYIPPFKLARMMKEVQDKSSLEYQRLTWDALRKSINGLVNKVNATNIKNIIPELFGENLIRGRGLFCRSCMKSQMASPGFTDVFAALVAVVNTKFPEVGELLLRRIVLQFKRAYKRNDKHQLLAAVKYIAHLVNQQVAHEIIALELLALMLENPTDDSVEVAVGFVKECGSILQDLSPKGLHGIFERFRGILHEGEIDKRVQFLIEGLFAIRKAKFQGHPAVRPELDLVEQEDQLTHEISLEEKIDPEITLDIFKLDPHFMESEKSYEELKKTILGEESEDEAGSDAGSEGEDEDEDENEEDEDEDEEDEEDEEQMKIKDETETNLVNLRRTIYLTIMSSIDFEEAGHKLLKIKLEPGQEMELCIMLLECCSQERTYLRYYGLLGQRFCMINKVHQENFEKCFVQQYSMIHRLETNKLRNVAKFFAHLLGTDALPWHVLAYIRLTEEDTTSSSRIFIKILFQELSEHLGIRLLNERLSDPSMQDSFESIFPKDNPKNTRFAINFFTSIGLGGITESLREYLKNMPRLIMQQQKPVSESDNESESSSGSSGSDSSGSESEPEQSSSSESDRDERRKKRRRH